MASVTLKNLKKSYGGLTVIPELDLEIEAGEFVALVGPSGCGKSTLLRMIAGLEQITGGEIWIEGRKVNDVSPKDRNIAMVFQSYALYPQMTVRQNMAFNLKLAGRPRDEIDSRVAEAARMLALEALLDRKPGQLSGGQRQRVAMGRAIVRSPKVFLFDEPLSNLDAKLRVTMRAEIKALHQKVRTTAIYVTHDQIEAMTLADRLVVLNKGVIEQTGSPLELYTAPRNVFVAGFIGSPSMNFLEARLERNSGEMQARFADGSLLTLPEELAPGVRDGVLVGLRPEHLLHRPGGPIQGQITMTEPTGSQTMVYFRYGGQDLVAIVDGDTVVHPGDRFEAAIAPERIYLFDKDSGVSLKS